MAYISSSSSFSTESLVLSDLIDTQIYDVQYSRGGWNWWNCSWEQDTVSVNYDPLDAGTYSTAEYRGCLPCGGLSGGVVYELSNNSYGRTGLNDNFSITGLNLSGDAILAALATEDTADDLALVAANLCGEDTFCLGDDSDAVNSYGGNDTVYARGGNDVIDGGDGCDTIYAGTGADVVVGGHGSDRIDLGSDWDTDTVVIEEVCDSGVWSWTRDEIYNFDAGEDRIDLSQLSDNLEFTGHSATANGVWLCETWCGDTYVRADVNGDRCADVVILVENETGLTATDFIL